MLGRTTTLDLIAEAMQGVAARWYGELDPINSYTVMIDILKQNAVSGRGLEIGGGYSTILLCELAERCGVRVESIDINPDKYLRIIPSYSSRRYLFNTVQRVDELSVSLEELLFAYQTTLPEKIAAIGEARFRTKLMQFCRDNEQYAENHIDLQSINICEIGAELLALPGFSDEKSFYIRNNLESGNGYCGRLAQSDVEYDFIFFDCGEYSSLAEWFLLESSIRPGGFALFHDIFFPKSIKNFLVATLIALSDEWNIVYVDHFSKQGALVAQKAE